MPVLRKKSRIITFRICGDEYDLLARAQINSGARSLSEFARNAVFEKAQALLAPRTTLDGNLRNLGRALSEVDDRLSEASKSIRRLLGSGDEKSILADSE